MTIRKYLKLVLIKSFFHLIGLTIIFGAFTGLIFLIIYFGFAGLIVDALIIVVGLNALAVAYDPRRFGK